MNNEFSFIFPAAPTSSLDMSTLLTLKVRRCTVVDRTPSAVMAMTAMEGTEVRPHDEPGGIWEGL